MNRSARHPGVPKMVARRLAALGLLASLGPLAAHAQDAVRIFGAVDAGVHYMTHADAHDGHLITMTSNGWNTSNRLDFAGTEGLGDGFDAHFLLESGFDLATGGFDNTTNTLFNRQSFAGLKSPWGSLDLGRQYTIAHDFILDYDPFHFNYTTLIPLTQASSGTRFNNDLKYTGALGGFKLELENSFGEITGSVRDASAHGIGLQYYGDGLTAGASYNRRSVQVGALYRDEDYILTGASFKHGDWWVSGGYMTDTIAMQGPTRDTTTRNSFGGASYPLSTNLRLTAGYYRTTSSSDRSRGKGLTLASLDWSLSKRTKLYLEADFTHYMTAVVSTLNTTGASTQFGSTVGLNHKF
jgi:predicted porin